MQEFEVKDLSPMRHRQQSGCFHVILNANYQNIVFNTNLEKIMFLKILDVYRKKFNAVIYAITLMHTHVHILIVCDFLSEMMKRALHDFSMWYNRFRGQKGSIFQRPFSSFVVRSEEHAVETLLYILRNPYVDGLASNPRYYKWSSYNCYFADDSAISKYIYIDKSLVHKYYGTSRELYDAVVHVPEDKREKFESDSKRVKDEEVLELVVSILKDRPIEGLQPEQIREIILFVRKEMPASIRQLASILRVSKEFVRRTIRPKC